MRRLREYPAWDIRGFRFYSGRLLPRLLLFRPLTFSLHRLKRLLFPELPWTRIAHKFSRCFDGRRFFGVQVCNAASKADGLYLQFSVQLKIDTPSDRKTYVWPHDS